MVYGNCLVLVDVGVVNLTNEYSTPPTPQILDIPRRRRRLDILGDTFSIKGWWSV